MKIIKLLAASALMFAVTSSFGAEVKHESISRSFVKKIAGACIDSIEKGKKKIPNPEKVCECIAETHFESANDEPTLKEGKRHIEWVLKFYETTDPKALQKLADKNPAYSSYDDGVVADCIESENTPADK